MTKIRLCDSKFGNYNGRVIDVDIDVEGDVKLPTHIADEIDYSWAFAGEFTLVTGDGEISGESDGENGSGYTLSFHVKDLLELHTVLDSIPTSMVESATLSMDRR